MRLKHIKLAGFKSFVDPTKVPFEHDMTAIVGPNGCGKSNIIDAVRWVLGESSAKNLRGDSMTDVIFNGAASRKPIGQASVELVFDNSSGRIKGSMADRTEVSIRRLVNRESQNSYFLNGSKCRRRDITDIFLGTGLGPRSYAIIEQGTISRLIESKPQDLRIFIEEAAGISKYKEQRRETENRIRHTRENLARLADIRSELALRIDTLHQQAEAAQRFRTLKQAERKLRAELAVLRWQQYQDKSTVLDKNLLKTQDAINDLVGAQGQDENRLQNAKQHQQEEQRRINDLQSNKLQLTTNIARAEQNIKHTKLQQNVLKQEQQVSLQKEQEILEQLKQANEKLKESNLVIEALTPKHQELQKLIAKEEAELALTNKALGDWQTQTAQIQQQEHQYVQLCMTIENKKSFQQQVAAQAKALIHKLDVELIQHSNSHFIDTNGLNEEKESVAVSAESVKEALGELEDVLLQNQADIDDYRQKIANVKGRIHAANTQVEQRYLAKKQQETWLDSQQEWLNSESITTSSSTSALPSLSDSIEVQTGWASSAELVLGHLLEGQLLSEALIKDELLSQLNGKKIPERVSLLLEQTKNTTAQKGTLSEKVSGCSALFPLLNNVLIAASFSDAVNKLVSLKEHQSVICPEGVWLSAHFVIKANTKNSGGLIISEEIQLLESEVDGFETQLRQFESHLVKKSEESQTLNTEQGRLRAQHAQLQSQQAVLSQQLTRAKADAKLFENKKDDLQQQLALQHAEVNRANDILEKLATELNDAKNSHVNRKETLSSDPTTNAELLKAESRRFQTNVKKANEENQQVLIRLERAKNTAQHNLSIVGQQNELLKTLQMAKEERTLQLKQSEIPLSQDESQLQIWLKEMISLEEELAAIQKRISEDHDLLLNLDTKRQQRTKEIERLKEHASKQHIELEGYKLRIQSLMDQLRELNTNIEGVKKDMPSDARESHWQAHLVKVAKDINVLGPINLAAIKEYEEQLSRKLYLDKQNDDLESALETLEAAIVKIDKQSRQQFKDTFEQVNSDLKSLFPKVFGGGSAYLDLTGDDMLETGVTIMARPPGKKNSTIHLLSGGEKALTALSLVFAIFRLNPAPFCMLDEVDAPLDDANVERFCNLVREMSQSVQFIYISHNKIAMEMASHLTGVTMFEAGVSRMVAVDIDEAIAMAEVT